VSKPSLRRDGLLFVVDFGDGENRIDVAWVEAMQGLLDEAESQALAGPAALVTTGSAKHYSNGLDVEFMARISDREIEDYVCRVEQVISRILTFPAPTVAALNGHAFGAGALLMLAHDYVVMRQDRGYVCWPEVHLQMAFPHGLLALIKNNMAPAAAREAVVTGRRFGAREAVAAGFVNESVGLDQLLTVASNYGRTHAPTAGSNLQKIKAQLHKPTTDLLGRR